MAAMDVDAAWTHLNMAQAHLDALRTLLEGATATTPMPEPEPASPPVLVVVPDLPATEPDLSTPVDKPVDETAPPAGFGALDYGVGAYGG